jgi:hypothetical protein
MGEGQRHRRRRMNIGPHIDSVCIHHRGLSLRLAFKEDNEMRKLIIAAAIAASSLLGGTAQAAMPVAGVTMPDAVVKVDYPCGRGWHLNRRGVCVRYDRWRRPPPPPPRWHRPPPRWDGPPPRWHRPPPPGYWRY